MSSERTRRGIVDKIHSTTIRERVYQELKSRILLGEIRPGEVVTQRDLADQFGVSVIPIREALFQLSSEDIILCGRSNRDIRVRELSPSEFCEIRDIRLLLEAHVTRVACAKRTDEDIQKLEAVWTDFCLAQSDPAQYLGLNRQFHYAIYGSAQMPLTLATITSLWTRIGSYMSIYTQMKGVTRQTTDFHARMFRGFAESNGDEVIAALEEDINASARNILTILTSGALVS